MAVPRTLPSDAKRSADADLPYCVELRDGEDRVVAVLAQGSSPGIGYAAYYAALREHLGLHVTLTYDGRRLAASRPLRG